jgi:hypothetical protein
MLNRAPPHRYYAYLLRCWQEPGSQASGLATWRFSLEDPHTGVRQGFANLEVLITFLQAQLTDESSTPEGAKADEPAADT